MRFSSYFLHALAATSVAARHILEVRQQGTTSAAASTAASAAPSTDGAAASTFKLEPSLAGATTSKSSAAASSTSKSSQRAKSTTGPFTLVPGSTQTVTGSLSSSTHSANDTTTGDPIPLPLTPKITPAVGFAGALLMITGLAYGLVGIRNKWLYNFFGVTYLVSLAVLVLILYCMNPPVSDSIQGAYFVGVLLAGCLCGGVGLIFRDLVEGFGCLLGGFCFSMWFLTLKDGGTITSSVGKAIFIGAFTVIVGATGLVKKTRKWGLIASIPFSGATATVLGIDCFSRAGLKEFWIYIWDINDNEFPLNTVTYPLTRGMKVEIAGIVILFLLGLASQLKLSTVLRQQMEQNKERKQRRLEDGERAAATPAKRISGAVRSSVYGEKGASASTVVQSSDTLDQKGFIVKERHASRGDLEMRDINRMSSRVTIIAPDDEIEESPRLFPQNNRLSAGERSSKWRLSAANSAISSTETKRESLRNSMTSPAPSVVPLPFRVDVNGPKSQGSLSAIEEDFATRRANSQRASGASWNRLSARSSMAGASASREELMTSGDEDRASSVAATLDDLDGDEMSISGITIPRSPMDDNYSLPSPQFSQFSHRDSMAFSLEDGEIPSRLDMTFIDEASGMLGVEAKPKNGKRDSHSAAATTETKDGVTDSKRASTAIDSVQDAFQSSVVDANRSIAPSVTEVEEETSKGSLAPISGVQSKRSSQQSEKPESGVLESQLEGEKLVANMKKTLKISVPPPPPKALTESNLSERVPDPMSKVALQYRTNEWAKHLESAAEPEDDVHSRPPSPGVQLDTSFSAASREYTPISPVVDPSQFAALKPTAKRSSTDPTAQKSILRAQSNREERFSSTSQLVKRQSSAREISDPLMLNRQSSGTMAWPGPAGYRGSRSVTSPVFGHQITESPIEAPVEVQRMGTQKKTPVSTIPETTLMQQRDSRLKTQPKTQSFQSFGSSTPNLAFTPATPAPSVLGHTTPIQGRTAALQDPSGRVSQLRRENSRQGAYTPQPVLTAAQPGFDSHQPQRPSSANLAMSQQKRETLLTNWRESLREDQDPKVAALQKKPSAVDIEAQRMRLLNEKRQRQEQREQESRQKKMVEESRVESMMKKADLIDAHKAAMMKMQAGVRK